MKNKVRGKLRRDKAEDTAKHGVVRGDRGIGQRQRESKIEEKISHFHHHRPRHRMAMAMTPRTINYPLGLAVDAVGAASAASKLTSHRVREAGLTRRLPEIR